MSKKANDYYNKNPEPKTIVQKLLHILKACFLSFYLKKYRRLNANPVEVIRVFQETLRIFPIFRFPAKNDQMIKRKYNVNIYQFVAYFKVGSKYIHVL